MKTSAAEWERTLRSLRDPEDPDRAVAAFDDVDRLADASRLPELHALLADPDWWVREAAAVPVMRLEGVRALPRLLDALAQGQRDGVDNDGLSDDVGSLIEANAAEAVPLLEERMRSDVALTRSWAAWGLGDAAKAISPDSLVAALRSDPDAGVRSAAAGSLASFEGDDVAFHALATALGDRDEGVRVSAISSLGHLGDPRAVSPLLQLRSRTLTARESDVLDCALRHLERAERSDAAP